MYKNKNDRIKRITINNVDGDFLYPSFIDGMKLKIIIMKVLLYVTAVPNHRI